MTPERIAEIAARAYQHMRPWSSKDVADTLKTQTAQLTSTEHAFVLGQVVADEAEILALAADPNHQRAGHASAALTAFHTACHARGAIRIFLDVSKENIPAIGFYEMHGYTVAGHRKGYYKTPDGRRVDAVLMARALP